MASSIFPQGTQENQREVLTYVYESCTLTLVRRCSTNDSDKRIRHRGRLNYLRQKSRAHLSALSNQPNQKLSAISFGYQPERNRRKRKKELAGCPRWTLLTKQMTYTEKSSGSVAWPLGQRQSSAASCRLLAKAENNVFGNHGNVGNLRENKRLE
jgi:hypothetical protein